MRQKNIVTEPNKKLKDLNVSFLINGSPVSFDILTNVKQDEMEAVIINWIARTSKFTAKSLVNYINTKNHYGFKAELKK